MRNVGTQKCLLSQSIFFLCLFYNVFLLAQHSNTGVVVGEANEPLAFVNILINGEFTDGINTDINGVFRLPEDRLVKSLTFSYVGYQTLELSFSENPKDPLHIQLEVAAVGIAPVVIIAGENPAHRIIRKAVAMRKLHNPEKRESYHCKTYNKMRFEWLPDHEGIDALKKDSLGRKKRKGLLRKYLARKDRRIQEIEASNELHYLFLMESITERKFQSPKNIHDKVLHNRVSGFEHPTFAALANAIQPFSFYKEHLEVLDKTYLNPISPNSNSAYYFSIQDTLYDGRDSIYIIHFEPRKGKKFDALKGLLYIHTNGYAIQNVIARPEDPAFIDLKIEQQYHLVNDEDWFPEQLNFELIATDYPDEFIGMKISGKSYISEVNLYPIWTSNDFNGDTWVLAEDANESSNAFWMDNRPQALTKKEQNTYKTIDSVGQVKHFDRLLKITEALISGEWQIGKTDLLLHHLLRFNEYENVRLGCGLQTNQHFSKWISFFGYGAYGTEDTAWKYGGGLDIYLLQEDRLKLSFLYRQDLKEPAGLFPYANDLFSNQFYADRMSYVEEQQISLRGERLAFLQFDATFRKSIWEPGFLYYYKEIGEAKPRFSFSELDLYFRYAFGEKTIHVFGTRVSEAAHFPVLELAYTKGFEGVFNGSFSFNRLSAAISHSFLLRRLGKLNYRLEGGIVDSDLPYNHLFVSNTVANDSWFMLIDNTFQTLQPYEFLSNRFAHLFVRYDMPAPIIKRKFFRPRISLLHNMGFGRLAQAELHNGISFRTMEEGHFESGLRVGDIVRIPYFNLAFIGIGAGAYYRYGTYALEDTKDNLSINMTLDFSF